VEGLTFRLRSSGYLSLEKTMPEFAEFYEGLHALASDGEVKAAILEQLSRHGTVVDVERFWGVFEKDKRYFLARFLRTNDAIRVANEYKLRSFGFYSVLFELNGEYAENS
jgi:hypothetical protein